MRRYLPPAFQEVADVVVSFGHQMEGFPDDLLLHVLRLQPMKDSSAQPLRPGPAWAQPGSATLTTTQAPSFHFSICWPVSIQKSVGGGDLNAQKVTKNMGEWNAAATDVQPRICVFSSRVKV